MSALSDRHEALFSQFFDIQNELISASELRKVICNRLEQAAYILASKSTDHDTAQQAMGARDTCRAIMLDIDTIMGKRS